MAHFSVLVLGGNEEEQLSIYDKQLPALRFKERLSGGEVTAMVQAFDVPLNNIDAIVELIPEWTGHDGGYDELGFFNWNNSNPRGKWDWWILGGRWAGWLRLKPGASGELGKRGYHKTREEVLPHGDLSCDRALLGDVDWEGMRILQAGEAERAWDSASTDVLSSRFVLGVDAPITRDEYIDLRSHPSTFAVVVNCDWHERTDIGWWGVALDARPVQEWHAEFDALLSNQPDDTIVSIIDCHA